MILVPMHHELSKCMPRMLMRSLASSKDCIIMLSNADAGIVEHQESRVTHCSAIPHQVLTCNAEDCETWRQRSPGGKMAVAHSYVRKLGRPSGNPSGLGSAPWIEPRRAGHGGFWLAAGSWDRLAKPLASCSGNHCGRSRGCGCPRQRGRYVWWQSSYCMQRKKQTVSWFIASTRAIYMHEAGLLNQARRQSGVI